MESREERLQQQLAKIDAVKEISPNDEGEVSFDDITKIVRR